MSAIFGICHFDDRPVAPELLDRMADVLAHCGKDGSACRRMGAIGFGHRMRYTTPESLHETLPYTEDATGLTITADARLDNRPELLAALRIDDAGISDSRLILAAYAAWGTDCLARFDGDFTFAIWDSRHRQLFCARDHFGLRPFYYMVSRQTIIFASEIKGVLAGGAPDSPNDMFLAGYLLGIFDDPEATAYREIHRLPAAHALIMTDAGVMVRRYWQLSAPAELRLSSDEEYADAFRESFTEAIRCRLRSAFPIGSMLSGGMDSSSVTCVARRLLPADQPLHTFSAIFDAYPSCDERPYINAVTARDGLCPSQVASEAITPFTAYVEGQVLQDEPYLGTTHYMHWGLYQTAQGHARILLEGHGGDSVISHGLTYLTELASQGHWGTMLREARAYGARNQWRVRDVLWEWVAKPLAPTPFVQGWRWWHDARQREARLQRAGVTPELIQQAHLHERLAIARRDDRPARSIRDEQVTELSSHAYSLIFDWFSTASLTYGLDVRYPFFDRRLIELCISLPSRQRLQDGWTRMVLRRAMEGILPERVQWRGGKANLSPCFYGNLYHRDRAWLEQTLREGAAVLAPYVDVSRVLACYAQWAAGGPGTQRLWEPIWYAATLAVWLTTRRAAGVTTAKQ